MGFVFEMFDIKCDGRITQSIDIMGVDILDTHHDGILARGEFDSHQRNSLRLARPRTASCLARTTNCHALPLCFKKLIPTVRAQSNAKSTIPASIF